MYILIIASKVTAQDTNKIWCWMLPSWHAIKHDRALEIKGETAGIFIDPCYLDVKCPVMKEHDYAESLKFE